MQARQGAAIKKMVPQEDLEQTFDRIWKEIRGAPSGSSTSNLYSGQPRSEASSRGVLLAQEALQLGEKSGRDHFVIEAWKMLAYTLNADERYEEAIPHYQRVINKLEEMGENAQAARQKIGFVGALFKAGRYNEALEVAHTAEEWFLRYNDEFGFARLCTNIGNIFHRTDDPMQAYRYHLMAAQTFEKVGDQRALGMAYMNLGNALADIDSFEKADEMYEKSEAVSRSVGMADLCDQAEYNRAWLHFLRGRYSDALQSFGRLRQRFEQSGSLRHYALCDLDEAEMYIHLNLSRDAATLAARAAERFEALGLTYEQAKATAFYGVSLIQMRRYSEALEAFRTAQTIFEAEGNSYWIGLLDLYRAEVQFSLQRFWEAQSLATQAKTSFENLSISSKRMFSLVLLGRVALALNDIAAAEAAINEISALTGITKIPLVLFPYHVLCAEIAERSRKWDEAKVHYENAAEDLERHEARLHHDDLRVTFFKGRQQAYDALVRLSLDRMDETAGLASAYAWCERARSRGLVELLSHYAPSGHGQAEPSLLTKVNRLREELNTHYARSTPEVRPIPSAAEFETIAFKEQELARTLREVSEVDPEYVSLQQVSIATIDSVKTLLPERTTLVEYFTTGDEVLVFVISKNGARVIRRLCPASRIISLQERLRFQLEKFMLGPEYLNAHSVQILESTKRHLHDLYRNLFAPVISEIHTPHVTIVPHGTLHFLPFHAFYDGEKYLIDHFEISYAPSASVLKYCLEKEDVPEKSPLLIGVADENAPLVASEIATLNRLFPNSRILQDEAATREAFVESSKQSSFLHIATHAVFRQDNPMFSSFKLGDGWFTALDLFSMTCQTNLVTLSGCQSGMSEVTGSDDLLGLMRGFLYAGARSLLVSLWNVNDESTAALMETFYQEWGQNTSKSTALRSAMLAVRKWYPNPFYWAPFLLVGNP
jgi:CHAT domain-containing protein/tetratricopeptide (TPR) repeat protein